MHFLHKNHLGTNNKMFCCAKFLISWLPKIRSCSLVNWESTFLSQKLAVLNLSHTVHKLYTWLTHPKQVCCIPVMSLVLLKGLWCPWQIGNNQTDLCEVTRDSSPLLVFDSILTLVFWEITFKSEKWYRTSFLNNPYGSHYCWLSC